jgi:hypothetical protein
LNFWAADFCSTMDSRSVRNRRQDVTCLVTYIYSSVLTATIEYNEHSLPRWQPLGKQNVKLSCGATKCHVKLSCTFDVCVEYCLVHVTKPIATGWSKPFGGWVGGWVHFQWHAGSIYLWADSQQFDWVLTRAQIQKSYARQSQRACQKSDSQGSTVLQKKNRALRVTPLWWHVPWLHKVVRYIVAYKNSLTCCSMMFWYVCGTNSVGRHHYCQCFFCEPLYYSCQLLPIHLWVSVWKWATIPFCTFACCLCIVGHAGGCACIKWVPWMDL